jgi:hypothetical protein
LNAEALEPPWLRIVNMETTLAETTTADATATPDAPVSNSKTSLSDAFREHFSGDAPFEEKVKSFAKAKPWASAALAGIAGVAVLSTLRGKR